MNTAIVKQTEAFLRKAFVESPVLAAAPEQREYRLEHSYRVANIGKRIAEAEGFDTEQMVVACLLHDLSYCEAMDTREQRQNHGRRAAQLARLFLESLGKPEEWVNDILYGIAIHVDDEADFSWRRTAFAETISDADNLDRFDVYRIYEGLEYRRFSGMTLEEKREHVESTLHRLEKHREMRLGTETATGLWREKVDYYRGFYERLLMQLDCSSAI